MWPVGSAAGDRRLAMRAGRSARSGYRLLFRPYMGGNHTQCFGAVTGVAGVEVVRVEIGDRGVGWVRGVGGVGRARSATALGSTTVRGTPPPALHSTREEQCSKWERSPALGLLGRGWFGVDAGFLALGRGDRGGGAR